MRDIATTPMSTEKDDNEKHCKSTTEAENSKNLCMHRDTSNNLHCVDASCINKECHHIVEGKYKKLTKSERKDKIEKFKKKMSLANNYFVRNNFDMCISTLKNILVESPKNSNAYFMLGLVFEETGDDIKAYNFFLVASQLMKTNYALFEKLYNLSTKLNLLIDKLYFIQILQRQVNKREFVLEKLEICKIFKLKYKILEVKIELFYFDGIDFDIFDKIRKETSNKNKIAKCVSCLIKYYKQFPRKCGYDFLQNIIRLQYHIGYFYGTRNLIESYLIDQITLPRDIRIIYVITVLVNDNTEDITTTNDVLANIEDLDFRESLFTTNESILGKLKQVNEFSDLYKSPTPENSETNVYSKTLHIDRFLFASDTKEYYSSLSNLINDDSFWQGFCEFEYIKGLLEALNNLKMEKEYLQILKILEINLEKYNLHENFDAFREFVIVTLGNFFFVKNDYSRSHYYFHLILETNPDNNFVKSKLYEIYKNMGSYDLANKFRTISLLINFVDDICSQDRLQYMSSINKCNENRIAYSKSRLLFKSSIEQYLTNVISLIEEFKENRFIFSKHKKFKIPENSSEQTALLKASNDQDATTENSKLQSNGVVRRQDKTNLRFLSLGGLNSDEWSAVLLEYILCNIRKCNHKEATYMLKKSLDCVLFKESKLLYTQFIFLTIKHSIFSNDLNLLSKCFKKTFSVFKDLSWANFYFYILNFFPDYIGKNSYATLLNNIRRIFRRNSVFVKGNENTKSVSVYKSLDLNLLLSSFFTKSIACKSYKIINRITLSENFRDKMLYYIILITTCRSRRNRKKTQMLKKGLDGLKSLLSTASKEEYCNLSYNIGIAYHMLGYIGFAEKYYIEALNSHNIELRRMARLNLIIIYEKNNKTMQKKMYDQDETVYKTQESTSK